MIQNGIRAIPLRASYFYLFFLTSTTLATYIGLFINFRSLRNHIKLKKIQFKASCNYDILRDITKGIIAAYKVVILLTLLFILYFTIPYFSIYIHEAHHALVALLNGGHIMEFYVSRLSGGYVKYQIPQSYLPYLNPYPRCLSGYTGQITFLIIFLYVIQKLKILKSETYTPLFIIFGLSFLDALLSMRSSIFSPGGDLNQLISSTELNPFFLNFVLSVCNIYAVLILFVLFVMRMIKFYKKSLERKIYNFDKNIPWSIF
ncbi:MAG: hypothetical protein GF317_20185 [Candidatus Lokiarchaeota archaeon]|nr:hypothetical protein [Candidatus Lokiarchaeota archaeon]MBD3201802.1 hypothetical protein [Candidatus Lokiarchaeota archaeon]